jgi:phage baseplate assembly protein W
MAQFNSKNKASRTARRWWTDIDINLTLHPQSKDVILKYDINSIKRSIKTLLSTNHYERPFKPSLGTNFSTLLFEMIDQAGTIVAEQTIKGLINDFEPRAEIDHLFINTYDNTVDISILFTVLNRPEPQELNLILERVR